MATEIKLLMMEIIYSGVDKKSTQRSLSVSLFLAQLSDQAGAGTSLVETPAAGRQPKHDVVASPIY